MRHNSVDWQLIIITVWVSACVCGAVMHGAYMENKRLSDGMRGTSTHIMVRAWYIASIMHGVLWTVVCVVPLVVVLPLV